MIKLDWNQTKNERGECYTSFSGYYKSVIELESKGYCLLIQFKGRDVQGRKGDDLETLRNHAEDFINKDSKFRLENSNIEKAESIIENNLRFNLRGSKIEVKEVVISTLNDAVINRLEKQIESLNEQLNQSEFQTRLINETIEEFEYIKKMLCNESN